MDDYKKVYEDAVEVHYVIERVKKSRDAALSGLDSIYLDPYERAFVKKAINAAYEPRIDDLLRKFFKVHEENKVAAEPPIEDVPRHYKELLTFDIDGIKVKLSREDCWRAEQTCIGSCDLTTYCPFFGRRNIEVGTVCRRILDAYANGQYEVTNGLFEEDSDERDN